MKIMCTDKSFIIIIVQYSIKNNILMYGEMLMLVNALTTV